MTWACSIASGRTATRPIKESWNLIRAVALVAQGALFADTPRCPAMKPGQYAGHSPRSPGGGSLCSTAMVSPSWPASRSGRRTAGATRYPARCWAGRSSAHTRTVLTRGCRGQLDFARIGSGKPGAASAGTPMRPDEPVRSVDCADCRSSRPGRSSLCPQYVDRLASEIRSDRRFTCVARPIRQRRSVASGRRRCAALAGGVDLPRRLVRAAAAEFTPHVPAAWTKIGAPHVRPGARANVNPACEVAPARR